MDSPIHIDTLSMGLSILHFMGSKLVFLNYVTEKTIARTGLMIEIVVG